MMNKNHNFSHQDIYWIVYGLACVALLILTVAAWLIVRIIDGMWLSWQLPAILAIAYFVVVTNAALFFGLKTIKQELEKSNANAIDVD